MNITVYVHVSKTRVKSFIAQYRGFAKQDGCFHQIHGKTINSCWNIVMIIQKKKKNNIYDNQNTTSVLLKPTLTKSAVTVVCVLCRE